MQNRFPYILFWKFNLFTFILLICWALPCFSMDVTLRWNANSEPDRAGYRIYYDTDTGSPYEGKGPAESDSPIDVKIDNVEIGDAASYTVLGLNDDESYFFAVTAYDTSGNESGYSNEVSTDNDISTDNEGANSGDGSGCFISTLNP